MAVTAERALVFIDKDGTLVENVPYNADPSRRVYDKGSTPVDLNLAYAFSRRLSVYADVINVFNVGTNHQFTYIRDRATRNDLYTTVIKFGLSGSF